MVVGPRTLSYCLQELVVSGTKCAKSGLSNKKKSLEETPLFSQINMGSQMIMMIISINTTVDCSDDPFQFGNDHTSSCSDFDYFCELHHHMKVGVRLSVADEISKHHSKYC